MDQPGLPVSPFPIAPGEVHLWAFDLDDDWDGRLALQDVLSLAEAARAGQFHFAVHRRRFVTGRGLLRCLLGAYLGLEARRVGFVYGPRGKPALAPSEGGLGLQFNLSHSGNAAVYAFCLDRPVGVDVEQAVPGFDWEPLARYFFHPGEVAVLLRLPPAAQARAFFRYWTRKEAYLKARGWGLGEHARLPDYSTVPDEPVRRVTDPADGTVWSCAGLELAPGWTAAVVTGGEVAGRIVRLAGYDGDGWGGAGAAVSAS